MYKAFLLFRCVRKGDDIIYEKGGEEIQWSRDSLFSKGVRKTAQLRVKE